MSKRSEEARIVEWFETAPLVSAEIVLGIVKRVMQRKRCGGDGLAVVERRKPDRPRKAPVDNPPEGRQT